MVAEWCDRYAVYYVAVSINTQEPDNHYIYVDYEREEYGHAYLVTGDLEKGHEFMYLPVTWFPLLYGWRTRMMRHVGWVAREHLPLLKGRLEYIRPPGRQIEWGNLVVPLERVQSSRTWTADAIEILLGEGYFTEIGLKDRIKRRLVGRLGHKGYKRLMRRLMVYK